MSQIVLVTATMVISTALILYLAVIAFQVANPIVAKLTTGTAFADFSLPALCQNLGIAAGLAGATFRSTDVLMIGVLLIALALLTKGRASPELHRSLEIPLLVMGLAGFGFLGLVHTVA